MGALYLKELAEGNRTDQTASELTSKRVACRHLVSLTTLLPTSQCVRGDDVPMDISMAEQWSTPGSLKPDCLTHSLFSLQPSLHTAPMMLFRPSLPILLLDRSRAVRPQQPDDSVALTQSAVSAVSSLSVKSRYLKRRCVN